VELAVGEVIAVQAQRSSGSLAGEPKSRLSTQYTEYYKSLEAVQNTNINS
jgi:hypothetical protein